MGGIDAAVDFMFKGENRKIKSTLEKMTEIIHNSKIYSVPQRCWIIFQLFHMRQFQILSSLLHEVYCISLSNYTAK